MGDVAKNGKDRVEVAQADSAPWRRADQVPGVVKNEAVKIHREIAAGELLQMKPLYGLATGNEERAQNKQEECNPKP